jgi:hypothetical protein
MSPARAMAVACAALLLGCGDGGGPLGGGSTDAVSASGRVHTLAGPVPANLQVMLQAGGVTRSAAVAPDGSFQISANLPGDSIDIIIDAAGGARATLPVLLRVGRGTRLAGASIMLVPARWVISGGTYNGQAVDISLDAAFRPPCSRPEDINCDGFYPAAWFTGPKLWQNSALPVPLAFDHARTHTAITAADSIAFWTIATRMNSDAGLPLFAAARSDQITVNAQGNPSNGVLVRVDTTLAGFGAWTNWWWNASGNLYAGVVRPRTIELLRSSYLMSHELLHTHGFKHSCSWTTVMSGYGSPCTSTNNLSGNDVAYLQLAYALNQRLRATGAQHGLIAALQGERVVLRGLPPYAPATLRQLQLMSADSIGHMSSSDEAAGHSHSH